MADDVRQFEKTNVNIMSVIMFVSFCVTVAGAVIAKPSSAEVKDIASTVVAEAKLADEQWRTAVITDAASTRLTVGQHAGEIKRVNDRQDKFDDKLNSALLFLAEQRGQASLRRVKRNIEAGKNPTEGVISE